MCIDIVELCLFIFNGQISSISDRVIYQRHDNGGVLLFHIFIYIFFAQTLQLNSIITQAMKYQLIRMNHCQISSLITGV